MRTRIVLALVSTLTCLTLNHAKAEDSSELIRASIIEKIARFITWPNWEDGHFTLCVADRTPLIPALQTYYANSTITEKPVKLLIYTDVSKLNECQILYLDDAQIDAATAILPMTQNHPILIIAEKKDAVSLGIHVDFYEEDNRLHLEVNQKTLSISGLKASYHLLKAAHLVE